MDLVTPADLRTTHHGAPAAHPLFFGSSFSAMPRATTTTTTLARGHHQPPSSEKRRRRRGGRFASLFGLDVCTTMRARELWFWSRAKGFSQDRFFYNSTGATELFWAERRRALSRSPRHHHPTSSLERPARSRTITRPPFSWCSLAGSFCPCPSQLWWQEDRGVDGTRRFSLLGQWPRASEAVIILLRALVNKSPRRAHMPTRRRRTSNSRPAQTTVHLVHTHTQALSPPTSSSLGRRPKP